MKNIITICASIFLLSGCSTMYTQGFDTYFWTSIPGEERFLFIEGKQKGLIPYLPSAPNCENDSSKQACLKEYLPSGNYAIEVRNVSGKVLYEETLTVKRRGDNVTIGTTTPGKGGKSVRTFKGGCLMEEFAE
ncbi:hypothetical protein LZZ85_05905 [Terrimonas sp. NA20]|uniref:Lipoprotein n=1 Tax=Terrimonas ginsenosidimutans TaxID=2908004 RepID=A0ABS9KN95_9BACT|nr:hypothetical protein [Terrimonas ginsenosidimutans]MCG2613803.1 hypothetical protein [Terrimonas ginsenosidimutans]